MSEHVAQSAATDVNTSPDVLIVGAGVTGIYALWRALEEGMTATVVEAGGDVGGTWYWNRYPEARFDSESYSYGFLFSEELWKEWRWSEKYASQPEIERYFQFAVDRLDLRRHMVFNEKVISAVYSEEDGRYAVATDAGTELSARYVIAASGNLSVPFIPNIEGRDTFAGNQHHTGRWPSEPVDFTGKRVAQIGTGSSGVQIVPAIADQVASLTVFQMKADWVTPLNNAPITDEEHQELLDNFEEIRTILNNSPSGFRHDMHLMRGSGDHTPEEWAQTFDRMWASGGFRKLTEAYYDLTTNQAVNEAWCAYVADKVRSLVDDPATAELLIPKDSGYGGRRPPFGTGYYEAFNNPNVHLVSLPDTPIVRIDETGIETADGHVDVDIIIWATGWDYGTGALNRMGLRGRDGLALEDHWADGPRTYLGTMVAGFPNLFIPGGPHAATGNNPRYAGDQVDIAIGAIKAARAEGADVVEVVPAAEDEWTETMNTSTGSSFLSSSYFHGANIPGKPIAQLLNPTGRMGLQELAREAEAQGYPNLKKSSAG